MLQQTLLEQIFPGNPSEGREAMLENVVNEYPYFSIAQYFLLKEKGGMESAPFHAAKTALHFSHPFLLQARLQDAYISMLDKTSAETVVELTAEASNPEQEFVNSAENWEQGPSDQEVVAEPITTSPLAEDHAPLPPREEKLTELAFEPLHTTDYFASQGIKLSEEMLVQDKLGRQMKSFTAWLKTMKRIPGATDQVPVDISVKAIAESSNREEEVYTESMAEVYVEQGKFGKARDIYSKLSLLNPSKSAYFAAKLEKIKDY